MAQTPSNASDGAEQPLAKNREEEEEEESSSPQRGEEAEEVRAGPNRAEPSRATCSQVMSSAH